MGLNIKKNNKGLYKAKDTVSGYQIHKKPWITDDELKALLIDRLVWRFMESCISIERTFPDHYQINGLIKRDEKKNESWHKELMATYDSKNNWQEMLKKFQKVSKKLKLDFNIVEVSDNK